MNARQPRTKSSASLDAGSVVLSRILSRPATRLKSRWISRISPCASEPMLHEDSSARGTERMRATDANQIGQAKGSRNADMMAPFTIFGPNHAGGRHTVAEQASCCLTSVFSVPLLTLRLSLARLDYPSRSQSTARLNTLLPSPNIDSQTPGRSTQLDSAGSWLPTPLLPCMDVVYVCVDQFRDSPVCASFCSAVHSSAGG